MAEQVQDHLAGHEFVQWPACPGHSHPLVPAADGADAVWRCRTSRRPLFRIGDLPAGP
ncbi:hypothetical protein ABTX81_13280 [Kitasatospora sp. NPDC097605]|uniref:hypothetical protein n=1 Tax=Kitasatospora sp. NPDC097605 TaxID=3157226 RepID=UPI00332A9F6A